MMLLTSNIWLLFMISIPHGNPLTIQVNQHVIYGNGYGKATTAITSSTTVPPTTTSTTTVPPTTTSSTTVPPTTTSSTTVPPTTVPPTTTSTTTVPPTTTSTTTVPATTTSSTTVPPTTTSTTTVPPTATSSTTVPPTTTSTTTVPPTTTSSTTVPPTTTSTTTVPPTTTSSTTVPPTTTSTTTVPPTTTSSTTVPPTTTSTTTVPPATTSATTVPPSTTSSITAPTTIPITSCSINGTIYPHTYENMDYVYTLRCDNGTWLTDGIHSPNKWKICMLFESINMIKTFDQKGLLPYSQKNCNFSSVQEGNSLSPSYYIYVSMYGAPSAVEFKENGLDAITCTDGSDINSCSFGDMSAYPKVTEVQPGVFAFTHNSIGVLMGPTISVWFISGNLFFYVPPTSLNSGKLGGFCGNYNGNAADDFALRDGTSSTSAAAITESWATGSC